MLGAVQARPKLIFLLAISVPVAEALVSARSSGIETIDERPREGGGGMTRIGFLHPRSTFGVLTELEEDVRKA